MTVERINNEILVRLSASIDLSELQNILDFLKYKENTAISKATQKDVDELTKSVNNAIWEKFKKKRGLK